MSGKLELCFAPNYVFALIKRYTVLATFDLVIRYENGGIIIVRRRISPYKGHWALPGLRIMKPERINDTIKRIAKQELGLTIDPEQKIFLGQRDGKFQTRHDVSTGYLIDQFIPEGTEIHLNTEHFSTYRVISSPKEMPKKMGSMYRFYIEQCFKLHSVNN